MRRQLLALCAGLGLTAGCYHAVIETGETPSPQVIEKPFASGWIYGLVPPSTVSTAAKCPGGVARVETQLSFVNQLVSALTFGIYTPMSIKVTCAAARTGFSGVAHPDLAVRADADSAALQAAFAAAATRAVHEQAPIFVRIQ